MGESINRLRFDPLMAYRKSKGKIARSRKIEPAASTMVFSWTVPAGTQTTNYLDLSQCASLVNRRFYRQGINWAVGGFKANVFGPAATNLGQIDISKLPETWVMSNAWEKGYQAYRKMNNEALEESESLRPRFEDFKIYADSDHHLVGYDANLLPNTSTSLAVAGEWESSKIAQPVTGPALTDPGEVFEREIIAVGANYPGASPVTGFNAVSLIEGYANSRALPSIRDPNLPDDGQDTDGGTPENWLGSIFNEGTQQSSEVLGVLTTENNQAPYPFENDGVHLDTMYPNGETQLSGLQLSDSSFITTTTVGGHTRLKGGMFPCGLIRIDTTNANVTEPFTVALIVDMVPGTHRGYLCQPMQDM